MPGTLISAPAPAGRGGSDSRQAAALARKEAHARPSPGTFLFVLALLLVFIAVCAWLRPSFAPLAGTVTFGFAIHYWLPFRFKEAFWIGLSIVGGTYLAAMATAEESLASGTITVALTVALGVLISGVVASPLPYRARLSLIAAVFGGVVWAGTLGRSWVGAPVRAYLVFGSAFMFQIVLFLYDAKHSTARVSLREFLRYFFPLPVFKLAGPILDYQGLRQSAYARRIQEVAPQGARWIALGVIQFAVFTVLSPRLSYARDASDPRSVYLVAGNLVIAYATYLEAPAVIHVFVGILKLFGYDLPQPYRWFALAHSPLDFWRRVNTYWRDAMMKVVFFPTYFALRKRSDKGAKLVALLLVFAASWALHAWGLSWLTDLRRPPWTTIAHPQLALFWAILALAASVNLWMEMRAEGRGQAPARRAPPQLAPGGRVAGIAAGPATWSQRARRYAIEQIAAPRGMHPLRAIAQIAAMWLFIAALFSLHNAPSIRSWLYTLKWWNG